MTVLPETLPAEFQRYRLLRIESSSPSFTDYEALHLGLDLPVRFRFERWTVEQTERMVRTLQRSRRLQADLLHPSIIRLFDFFESGGGWFTVFPVLPQLSLLTDRVKSSQQTRSTRAFTRLGLQLTDAHAAIHEHGFIMRSLRASALLVDAANTPYIADLGMSTPIG